MTDTPKAEIVFKNVILKMNKIERQKDRTKENNEAYKTNKIAKAGLHKLLKQRKNCECCPGHYLIVNHYSSLMS